MADIGGVLMQDRFKFRVWNKEYSKLYTWEDIIDKKGNCSLYWCMLQAQNDEANNILMQCTGLKDKNGKLIYEGDIVKQDGDNFEIKYCEKCKSYQCFGKISWVKEKFCYACEGDYIWSEFIEELDTSEVIGNIYENPELLEA